MGASVLKHMVIWQSTGTGHHSRCGPLQPTNLGTLLYGSWRLFRGVYESRWGLLSFLSLHDPLCPSLQLSLVEIIRSPFILNSSLFYPLTIPPFVLLSQSPHPIIYTHLLLHMVVVTADEWDCVACCYFIDTGHNVIQYLEKIYHILKPGGVWINFGKSSVICNSILYQYHNV